MRKSKDCRSPKLSISRRSRRGAASLAANPALGGNHDLSRNGGPARPARSPAKSLSPSASGSKLPRLTRAGLAEKVKELIQLAREQGCLTHGDIHEALADHRVAPEEREEIQVKLRNLEIDVVDQAEVDRGKPTEQEGETDKSRLDILDDPVRMYLKQMGQVPLLTRDQEVEISRRIENAEAEIIKIIYCLGFAAKEHIALAEKLVARPPKERFDRVILEKKVDGRDRHLRELRKLVPVVRSLDQLVDEKYVAWRDATSKTGRRRAATALGRAEEKFRRLVGAFAWGGCGRFMADPARLAGLPHSRV